MADADLIFKGWDEFEASVIKAVDNWGAKKKYLLRRLAMIYQAEVKKLTPVDTGRLRASIVLGNITEDEAVVGTNVEYALFVNDGHVQHRRWLPCRFVTGKGVTRIVYERGSETGVMLRETFVQGKHFFENAEVIAKPRMKKEVEDFMREILREVDGGA